MSQLVSFKFCPQCGAATVQQADVKSLGCQRCDWVYFHNTAGTAGAIIVEDDRLLVCRRAFNPGKGLLDVPGGFVDYDETLEEAITREVHEETGLQVTRCDYFMSQPNTYQYRDCTYKLVDSFFVCHVSDSTVMQASDDAESLEWMPLETLPYDAFAFDSVKHVLRCFDAQRKTMDR